MKIFKESVFLVLMFLGSMAYSEPQPKFRFPVPQPLQNVVLLDGPISIKSSLKTASDIINTAKKVAGNTNTVNVVIDSPGGSVAALGFIVDAMELARQNGVKVECYVPRLAASLAFQVLLFCDSRHALKGSLLLWHRARVFVFMGVLTSIESQRMARELTQTDDRMLAQILDHLNGNKDEIVKSYEAETLNTPDSVEDMAPGFLKIETYIPGLLEMVYGSSSENKTEDRMSQGDIVYIN